MTKSSSTADHIATLRKIVKSERLDGYLVPRSDAFLGEYVPPSAERLRWVTGFSGSWGLGIVAPKANALVVDGRYAVQAKRETSKTKTTLLTPSNIDLCNFFKSNFKKHAKIGFDPWTISISECRRIAKIAAEVGVSLLPTADNLVDKIWLDRPSEPAAELYEQPINLSGCSAATKLKGLSDHLKANGCDLLVLSDPHSVAWALNIRGSDIAHTPIPLIRALVDKSGKATLFVEAHRVPPEMKKEFSTSITLVEPRRFEAVLLSHGKNPKAKIMLDPACCPAAVRLALSKTPASVCEATDPCILPRAQKNSTEIKGARAAQLRDGAALSNFLSWFNTNAAAGTLTEKQAQEKLAAFRRATGRLIDLSFGTISASGPNAALPHYHVSKGEGRTIKQNDIYLVDSGGQYRDGTTDVTRTVIVGQPSRDMRLHFTLVLKGMIAVSVAKFPQGTTGVQIDALARNALWQHGFDFDHGTGHGVGSFLSVHEGPARISKAGNVALEAGMILSNEPGYYAPGKYGIRIENLLLVKPAAKPNGGNRPMLSFETLTYAPIDRRLIDQTLLTKAELQWLDHYHQAVLAKLGKRVESLTRPWLITACAPFT